MRAKELIDEGAFGRVFQIKHGEQHSGPHSDWFWQGERSGGGVMMDMGCHGVEVIRWMYDKPAVESVTAELGTFMHAIGLISTITPSSRSGSSATGWV